MKNGFYIDTLTTYAVVLRGPLRELQDLFEVLENAIADTHIKVIFQKSSTDHLYIVERNPHSAQGGDTEND